MTEERTSIIEVGDTLETEHGVAMTVTSVVSGEHGFLWGGHCVDNLQRVCYSYCPYELPPMPETWGWYDWTFRHTLKLGNGMCIGSLSVWPTEIAFGDIDSFEAKWLRTVAAHRAEEGVMQSRPTEIRLN